ncbi:MAG TPA: ATP-binding protein [Polyangiaceae bacterium]|nr:ATP-binding protein [Polyangiaceae bacterium]
MTQQFAPEERPTRAHGTATALAQAHAQFARAALGIYLAAAAAALALVVGVLTTERAHEEDQLREQLLAEANLRGHYLVRYLDLLVQQLRRLGLRSDVTLLDQNLAPERSLVNLSHQKSAFFNLGVAILGVDGQVLWEGPEHFLPRSNFADREWFGAVEKSRAVHVIPVDPERAEDAVLYVVSPIVRDGLVTGALLGAVDLKHGDVLAVGGARTNLNTVVATGEGIIVYPPAPPGFAHEQNWLRLASDDAALGHVTTIELSGTRTAVALTPVEGTELELALLVPEHELLHETRARIQKRIAVALAIAAVPLFALVVLLRRSLSTFRRSEERAVREERLQRVGEAANLIAHEVKNSLNGIRMAAELACDPGAPGRDTALQELRGEISRLANFTAELMTFSKGVVPRKVRVNLTEFVPKVTSLLEKSAKEAGVTLELTLPSQDLDAEVDPQLLHIVVSNLVTNAIEALAASADDDPRIDVRLERDDEAPGGVRLEVSDNGPGLREDIVAQLFEPFHSGKPSGVGIGLALSQRIARAHGGKLALVPSRKGALFVLTLPGGPS